MKTPVNIRELAAWDLDVYPWREQMMGRAELAQRVAHARKRVCCRVVTGDSLDRAALLTAETLQQEEWLQPQRSRRELRAEMEGLDWSLGVVDLRRLIAFQRRLVIDPEMVPRHVPQPQDWQALSELAFEGRRSLEHRACSRRIDADTAEMRLHSSNPDLRIAVAQPFTGENLPLRLTGGSPFFEVAEYRGRWFLRDGYHRAFHMLRAGLSVGFAVIVRARTMDELGAVDPWFFSEEILFSTQPPMVTDFLEDDLVLTYARPRLRKTITVRIEESLEPEEALQTGFTGAHAPSGGRE
jgi:hypothetical protein